MKKGNKKIFFVILSFLLIILTSYGALAEEKFYSITGYCNQLVISSMDYTEGEYSPSLIYHNQINTGTCYLTTYLKNVLFDNKTSQIFFNDLNSVNVLQLNKNRTLTPLGEVSITTPSLTPYHYDFDDDYIYTCGQYYIKKYLRSNFSEVNSTYLGSNYNCRGFKIYNNTIYAFQTTTNKILIYDKNLTLLNNFTASTMVTDLIIYKDKIYILYLRSANEWYLSNFTLTGKSFSYGSDMNAWVNKGEIAFIGGVSNTIITRNLSNLAQTGGISSAGSTYTTRRTYHLKIDPNVSTNRIFSGLYTSAISSFTGYNSTLSITNYNTFHGFYGATAYGFEIFYFDFDDPIYEEEEPEEPVIVYDIDFVPDLNFNYYDTYYLNLNLSSYSVNSADLNINGINADGVDCWKYFYNGSCYSETLYFGEMNLSDGLYISDSIRPDFIYPKVTFANNSVMWETLKTDYVISKGFVGSKLYAHVINYTNPFTMSSDTSLYLEFYAEPRSATSFDLQVYLVEGDLTDADSYFSIGDWRVKNQTILASVIESTDPYDHEHSVNSKHYVVKLETDSNGLINGLDLSNNFYMVLYTDTISSPNSWNLKYILNTSICDNTNGWYMINQNIPFSTLYLDDKNGCPDAHFHVVRHNQNFQDAVNVLINVDTTTDDFLINETFYYIENPNLSPNPTDFIQPIQNETITDQYYNVIWFESNDPNDDWIYYKLNLYNNIGFKTELKFTTDTNYLWDTLNFENGNYTLEIVVSDTILESENNITITLNRSFGCTDETATNYNETYVLDDGSCIYEGGGYIITNVTDKNLWLLIFLFVFFIILLMLSLKYPVAGIGTILISLFLAWEMIKYFDEFNLLLMLLFPIISFIFIGLGLKLQREKR